MDDKPTSSRGNCSRAVSSADSSGNTINSSALSTSSSSTSSSSTSSSSTLPPSPTATASNSPAPAVIGHCEPTSFTAYLSKSVAGKAQQASNLVQHSAVVVTEKVHDSAESLTWAAVTLAKMSTILIITGILSVFLYGSFYYAYVPVAYLTAPLHFERVGYVQEDSSPQYGGGTLSHGVHSPSNSQGSCSGEDRHCHRREKQQSKVKPSRHTRDNEETTMHRDEWETGHVGETGGLWVKREALVASIRVGEGEAAYGAGLEDLYGGQSYSLEVSFNMPESKENVGAGAFSVTLSAHDASGDVVRRSRRMAMLTYRSWLLRIIDAVILSPLYLLGLCGQQQERKVTMDEGYREDTFRPTRSFTVELGEGRLQVYSASLTVKARLTGVRYWVFHWPISSAVIGSLLLQGMLAFVAFTSWIGLGYRRKRREGAGDEAGDREEVENCAGQVENEGQVG